MYPVQYLPENFSERQLEHVVNAFVALDHLSARGSLKHVPQGLRMIFSVGFPSGEYRFESSFAQSTQTSLP